MDTHHKDANSKEKALAALSLSEIAPAGGCKEV